jgi:hypothetical protein
MPRPEAGRPVSGERLTDEHGRAYCAVCAEPMWRALGNLPASHVRRDHPEDHLAIEAR